MAYLIRFVGGERAKMNKKLLGFALASLAVAIMAASIGAVLARPFYMDMTVEKAARMVLSEGHHDLVVIDLRPSSMFASAHIPDAINVPVIELTAGPPILHWDVLNAWIEVKGQNHLNDKIIIHCLAGLASPTGAQNLIDAGFKKVYSIDGGFIAWAGAGYPTES